MAEYKGSMHTKIGGRFKLVITDKYGNTREATDWFDNVVLDQGLNRLGTGGVMTYCHVGSSNVTPTFTQTQLQALSATSSSVQATVQGSSGSVPYYKYIRKTFRFAAGTLNNVNLSEVGFGWAATATSLFNRALIKDSNGNPTTITVLTTDVLDVICELRSYQATPNDVQTNLDLGISQHTVTQRAVAVNTTASSYPVGDTITADTNGFVGSVWYYSASLSAVTATGMGGTSTVTGTHTVDTYVNNSLKRTFKVSLGLNDGNSGSLDGKLINIAGLAQGFQLLFVPAIPKTSTRTLDINFEISWSRYTP